MLGILACPVVFTCQEFRGLKHRLMIWLIISLFCHTNYITYIFPQQLFCATIYCVLTVIILTLYLPMQMQFLTLVCLPLTVVSRTLVISTQKVVYLGGLNGLIHFVKSPYFGIKYGLNVDALGQVLSPTVWGGRGLNITTHYARSEGMRMMCASVWPML